MGASTFQQFAPGSDVTIAFNQAVAQAQYDHGHNGYSGTIAEKRSVVVIEAKPQLADEAMRLADLPENIDEKLGDKWGPAGAIRVIDPEKKIDGWLFFGWASI